MHDIYLCMSHLCFLQAFKPHAQEPSAKHTGLARTVFIHTVYDRLFNDFLARNTVYAPHILYGSGQPCTHSTRSAAAHTAHSTGSTKHTAHAAHRTRSTQHTQHTAHAAHSTCSTRSAAAQQTRLDGQWGSWLCNAVSAPHSQERHTADILDRYGWHAEVSDRASERVPDGGWR